MTDPTILCPTCGAEIRLTESLAAPLIQTTRQEYERKLAEQNDQMAQRERKLREEQKAVSDAKREIERNEEQDHEALKPIIFPKVMVTNV